MSWRTSSGVRHGSYSLPSNVKMVEASTWVWSISKAFRIYLRRKAFSCSLVNTEFPTTQVMLWPCNILLTPTIFATFGTAVIWTTGIPIFSILDAIVAPQRVLEPQVEVRITASMPPLFLISTPISSPISAHLRETVAFPEVEKKVRWSLPTFPSLTNSRIASTGTSRFGSSKT